MKAIFKKNITFGLLIPFAFLFSNPAMAGDIMEAGTVLEEDSYVFTIDEATDLLNRVEELEKKELLLEEYTQLNLIQSRQIELYRLNYDILDQQRIQYTHLITLNEDLLERSRRQHDLRELKNWGIFSIGVAVTIGAFLAADRIGDTMETTY